MVAFTNPADVPVFAVMVCTVLGVEHLADLRGTISRTAQLGRGVEAIATTADSTAFISLPMLDLPLLLGSNLPSDGRY